MTLDDAVAWMKAHNGTYERTARDAERNYYQARVGPHISDNIGIDHNGRMEIAPTDPEFVRIFPALVESVKRAVDAYEARRRT